MSADLILALVPGLSVLADSDTALWLLAAGPAGGAATYWLIYRYYRNTDKSHQYERDTIINAQPVQGGEQKIDHISRTRDDDIKGDNRNDHRRRVQRVR